MLKLRAELKNVTTEAKSYNKTQMKIIEKFTGNKIVVLKILQEILCKANEEILVGF